MPHSTNLVPHQAYFRKGPSTDDFGPIQIVSVNPTMTTYKRYADNHRVPTSILQQDVSHGEQIADQIITELQTLGLGFQHWQRLRVDHELPVRSFPPLTNQAPIQRIQLTHIENENATVNCNSFTMANEVINDWADSVPASGGYDHVQVLLTWQSGMTRNHRLDMTHAHATEPQPLSMDILSQDLYYAGLWMPLRLIAPAQYLSQITPYRQEALNFLDACALME